MEFELGQPFRPYQQLMGVLPDRSKQILPMPYHDLMTNPDSPIIDFYPRGFELDMNGKKMEWEAVVKIPFIDERRLLTAMKPKDNLLSEAEKERNEFGVSLKFTYSPDADFVYPSSLAGKFEDLSHCHCVENIFDLPTIEGLDFHVGLIDGVRLGQAALAGFPSLKTLTHSGNLDFYGVSVFQQDSRNESMIVTILDSEKRTKVESAKALLGRKIYVGYPFLAEAKVARVSDELFSYGLPQTGQGPAIAIPHGPQEIELWRKKAAQIEAMYGKRLGMIIGHTETLVHVEMLKGLKKTDDGSTVKEYAHVPGVETDYASQTTVEEVISEDLRFVEKPALPIEQEFPIGTRAFFLGEYNYGRPLEVVDHVSDKAEIWVSTTKSRLPEFGRTIVKQAEDSSPYAASYNVAKMLNLSPLVLSKVTSAFQVNVDDTRVNLGLNLKFESKQLKVLGYSRRGLMGWEFSQKAIQLLQEYMIKFPDFIAGIMRNPQGNIYEATDLFPNAEAKVRVKEIQEWLKTIESRNFEKVPLEAEQLDSDAVRQIEEAADNFNTNDPLSNTENKKIRGVPRKALLKPSDAEHRLGHQEFKLGDRVVYVQDSGRVPIATQGTVVGKIRTARKTLLDVVFDVTFMSGTSLEDRCSPFRGSTVSVHSVLNITDRQLVAGSRAGENYKTRSDWRSSTMKGDKVSTRSNTQGHLIPAQAPSPLRGSFRQAVTAKQGTHRGGSSSDSPKEDYGAQTREARLPIRNDASTRNGGRVRGRFGQLNGRSNNISQQSTQNGYHKLDQGDPTDGVIQQNPLFQPRSYSNVPPPSTLERRGRGRAHNSVRGNINAGRPSSRGRAMP